MEYTIDTEALLQEVAQQVAGRVQIPANAAWDKYIDNNREVIAFRMADRSVMPAQGFVVEVDMLSMAYKQDIYLASAIADVFVQNLQLPLPRREAGEEYPKQFLRLP